ncbi:helix-turn-helix domain-containing protein [Pseudonocardia hispaniensis]|uniref:Helix-turn-helix domain-containing protein n=1 Tax=Pseudonocardia hispaniensis TaxID=904933 RepID=A0ABW1IWS3_9PSEU
MTSWPFPGDLPVDRARQVARTFRDALHQVDPDAAAAIEQAAVAVGETWLRPAVALAADEDFVSVADAADIVGCSVRLVYKWVADGVLPSYPEGGKIRVRVGEARRVDAERRARAY